MDFNIIFKDIVKQSGFSIEEFAEGTGIPINSLLSYQSGRTQMPIYRLKMIIKFLASIEKYELIKKIFNYFDNGNWKIDYLGGEVKETPQEIFRKSQIEYGQLIATYVDAIKRKPLAPWDRMKIQSHIDKIIYYANCFKKLVEENKL